LDQARSNLQNLVLTNKGERVMHPNFGCDVWKMLFDFELKQINVQLKKVIIEQTKMWLPYITVDDVLFDRVDGDDHTLSINIIFSLLGNKINMQTMNLTVGNM
jgi:phage baseplate assembly protein W